MIGKVIIGKSFRGCLAYCLHDKQTAVTEELVMKDRAEVILYNKCGGTEIDLLRQFNDVRQLNPKLAKPVLHITLSLAPGEMLGKDKLMDLCEECAREMGFANNQYVAVLHKDTEHQHLHIVANRIGFDKRTVSDSNSFKKIAQYCRKMELKHNLQQVLSPRQFLSEKERLLPRQDLRKEQLKKHLQHTLWAVSNYQQFEQKMKELGYQVLKGRGISFIDDKKVKIKGSEVGFSLMKIEKILSLQKQIKVEEGIEKFKNEVARIGSRETNNTRRLTTTQRMLINFNKSQELEQSLTFQHKMEIAGLIGDLLAPLPGANYISPDLLREAKKRKKKRGRSL